MRILKSFVAAIAACALLGSAYADERAEIADLQARIATLEAATMAPAGGGDAESLTSLHTKKGAVKIGGAVEIDVTVVHQDEANSTDDSIDSSSISTSDADLDIRVDAGADTYLFMKLDLDGFDSGDTSITNDLLEEVKFVWENVRGSNWTLVFGRQEMPFGQDKDLLITEPFVHGQGSAFIARDVDQTDADATSSRSEQDVRESQVIMPYWGGEVDNRIGLKGLYKYKELGTFELAVFQNSNHMHEDRSADNGVESFASRVKYFPVEGLTLQGSIINLHDGRYDEPSNIFTSSNSFRDTLGTLFVHSPNYAIGSTYLPNTAANEVSTSLAFDYLTKDEKWNIYGEWIHTWNAGHFEDLTADVFSLGVSYAFSPKLSLNTRWDCVILDNQILAADSSGIGDFSEIVNRASLGATYTCDNGIYFVVEYAHEWYNNNVDGWDDGDADIIAARVAYQF